MITKKLAIFSILSLAIFTLWSVSVLAQIPVEPGSSTPIPIPQPRPGPQPLPTPTDVQCLIGCYCDLQGQTLFCEISEIPIPTPQPIPQPTPQPIPVPIPTPTPQPVPQPLPTPVPVSLPTNVQWSTSASIKVEITASEMAINTPQLTTSKLPANCIREGETITCPTSETKQIVVPIISGSTTGSLQAIAIQKQIDGTIGITSQGVTASTVEKITVENNKLFVGATESVKPVNVLPNEARSTVAASVGITSVATAELKIEEQRPIYIVQGVREARLLFFIPVSIEITAKIDATNGEMVSVQKPWWSFLVW